MTSNPQDPGHAVIRAALTTIGYLDATENPHGYDWDDLPVEKGDLPSERGVYWWTAPNEQFTGGEGKSSSVLYIGSGTGEAGLRGRLWDEIRWARELVAQPRVESPKRSHRPGDSPLVRALAHFQATLHYVECGAGQPTSKEIRVVESVLIRFFSHVFYTPPPFNSGAWAIKGTVFDRLNALATDVRVDGVYP